MPGSLFLRHHMTTSIHIFSYAQSQSPGCWATLWPCWTIQMISISTYWTGYFNDLFDWRFCIHALRSFHPINARHLPVQNIHWNFKLALMIYSRILLFKRALTTDLFFCLTIYEQSLASTIFSLSPRHHFTCWNEHSSQFNSGIRLRFLPWESPLNTIRPVGWAVCRLFLTAHTW